MTRAVLQEHLLTPGTRHGAIWRYSPAHPKLLHFHGQLELLLVKRGSVVERVGQRLFRAHAGQLFWHLPGLEHQQVSASSDLDLRVVHIEPRFASASLLGSLPRVKCNAPSGFSTWLPAVTRLVAGRPVVELRKADFLALLDAVDAPCDTRPELRDTSPELTRALQVAWRATQTDHDDRRPQSLAELASGMLFEDPSLGRRAVCRELGVSEGFFSRAFSKELGTTFQEQRARIRVAEFVDHVAVGRFNALHAALRSGFGSYSQLYRAFTRQVGMGPRRYLFGGGRNMRALMPA